MKRLVLLLLLCPLLALAASQEIVGLHLLPGLTAELVLLPAQVRNSRWRNSAEFELAAGGAWLLTPDNIVDLGLGQPIFVRSIVLDSFTRTAGGSVIAIAGDRLGVVSGRVFLPTIALPVTPMRVAAGSGEYVYLYGGPSEQQRIVYFDGKRTAVLATVPMPITALTRIGNRVIFACGSSLYTLRPGMPPALLFGIPDQPSFVGLAVNPQTGELFAATEDAIYQLDAGIASQIAEGVGGALRWAGDALYVVDPKRQLMMRIRASVSSRGTGP